MRGSGTLAVSADTIRASRVGRSFGVLMVKDPISAPDNDVADLARRQHSVNDRIASHRFNPAQGIVYGIASAALLGGFGALFGWAEGKPNWTTVLVMAVGGFVAGFRIYSESIDEKRKALSQEAVAIKRQISVEQLEAAHQEDFFGRLVGINFRYIEQYYLQTGEQADKSFRLSALVATVGFMTLLAGVFLMYRGAVEAAYVTAAAGVFTEFIGAVFFYLYNRTILKMGEYHKKLVLTQNLSLALKISESLGEPQKTQALMQLMDRLSHDINRLLVTDEAKISPIAGVPKVG
jgi:hypothetical protein